MSPLRLSKGALKIQLFDFLHFASWLCNTVSDVLWGQGFLYLQGKLWKQKSVVHITCINITQTAIFKCIGWKGKTFNKGKLNFSEKINITTSSSRNLEAQFIVCFNYESWFVTLKQQWFIKRSIWTWKGVWFAYYFHWIGRGKHSPHIVVM